MSDYSGYSDKVGQNLQAYFDGIGIPTIEDRQLAKQVQELDAETLSGALARAIQLPELVEHDAAANTLLAMMRQNWQDRDPAAKALMLNFTQRLLDDMGLTVKRKDK